MPENMRGRVMSRRVEQKAQARERIAAQLAAQQRAERRRRLLLAVGAVVVVIVIVGGLITIRLVGGGKKTETGPSGAADAQIMTALTSIPDSTFAAIGSEGVQAAPSAIEAPALTADGKPKVLYIGAEFCPYCAAERWPVSVALSRFGTFSNLGTTHSSGSDVFPNTPTLSFHGATFTSQYLSFTGVETTTNEEVNGQYKPLDTPTAEDQKTFDTYNQPPYVKSRGPSRSSPSAASTCPRAPAAPRSPRRPASLGRAEPSWATPNHRYDGRSRTPQRILPWAGCRGARCSWRSPASLSRRT
jgi:Domain of unknown function (DUF929)